MTLLNKGPVRPWGRRPGQEYGLETRLDITRPYERRKGREGKRREGESEKWGKRMERKRKPQLTLPCGLRSLQARDFAKDPGEFPQSLWSFLLPALDSDRLTSAVCMVKE